MTWGLRLWDGSGALTFDSDLVTGAAVVDVLNYAGGDTDTLTYPEHAGRSVMVVPINAEFFIDFGVTSDTSLGYPRVTVATGGGQRFFIVVVW